MRAALSGLLECPACHTSIEYRVLGIEYKNGDDIIAGMLSCKKKHRFAVENGIPMLREDFSTRPAAAGPEDDKKIDYASLPLKQRQTMIRSMVKQLIHVERARTPYAKGILERDLEYRTKFSRKDKYVDLIRDQVRNSKFKIQNSKLTILEIGIGQGGFATSLKEGLKPTMMIGLDRDPQWARVAKLHDPSIEVIVGDATNLPIRSGTIDLVAGAYLLEHIRNWESVIDEAARVGKNSFFIWSPNRNFPWDYGHFRNAPLVPWLAPALGQYIAWAIAHAKGFSDTLEQCREELATMNYVSPGQFERYLKQKQIAYRDLFVPFVSKTLDQSYQYWRLAKMLKVAKPLAVLLLRALHALKVQPMMVYFLTRTAPGKSGIRSSNTPQSDPLSTSC